MIATVPENLLTSYLNDAPCRTRTTAPTIDVSDSFFYADFWYRDDS